MSRVAQIKKTKKKSRQHSVQRRLSPETLMLLRQFFFGTLLFLLLIIIITGIWYGTRIEALTIDEVTVTGGETISHVEIAAVAKETLTGTYFRLIPRRFAWFYPHTQILEKITAYERVHTVSVDRVSGKALAIHLTEYIPTALWCVPEALDNCVFIDATGYAFTPAPQLIGGSLVRYVTLGADPVLGQRLTDVSNLASITWFISALESQLGWSVMQVEIDSVGDVFYRLADRSEIKMTIATDPATVFANLATVLEADDFAGLVPGDFQYIDLRFGNKVFVNREPWDIATSTDAVLAEGEVPLSPPEAALAVPVIEGVDVSVETEASATTDIETPPAVIDDEVAIASSAEESATTSTSTQTTSSSIESE